MNLGDIMDIAVSGLAAQRARMTTVASNLANANTTRTAEGGAYQRRDPVFRAEPVRDSFASHLDRQIRKVEVERIARDRRPPIERFDPGHPDANEAGFIAVPRVNPVEEMANMMSASRSYDANLMLMRKVRSMSEAALQIGRAG